VDIPYGVEIPLSAVLNNIDTVDSEAIIFLPGETSHLTPDTLVYLVQDEEDAPSGSRYLLEVFLIEDVLTVWSEWRSGAHPSDVEKCDAVAYYAENDAYLPA